MGDVVLLSPVRRIGEGDGRGYLNGHRGLLEPKKVSLILLHKE